MPATSASRGASAISHSLGRALPGFHSGLLSSRSAPTDKSRAGRHSLTAMSESFQLVCLLVCSGILKRHPCNKQLVEASLNP